MDISIRFDGLGGLLPALQNTYIMLPENKVTFYDPLLWYLKTALKTAKNQSEAQAFPATDLPQIKHQAGF